MSEASHSDRLKTLRQAMASRGLDVYLVPSSDEHQNEYLPPHKLRREAISGFTGSAGDVAVCREEAHLFVDSRYHLQADQEAPPGLFTVHKLGLDGEVDLTDWLTAFEAATGSLRVGYDPYLITLRGAGKLARALRNETSVLAPLSGNLVDQVWEPAIATGRKPVRALPDEVTGESVEMKLARLRERMEEPGVHALVLTKLDEVAWLTNLRGEDIPHNPVFEAYAIATRETLQCFTDAEVPEAVRLARAGAVEFLPYDSFPRGLRAAAEDAEAYGGRLWLDEESASHGVLLLAGETPVHQSAPNPVVTMKAAKNPVEIEGMRAGHLKAACAKVRAFSLLEARLGEGERVSEAGFAEMLGTEYEREEGYRDLSFGTISAFGPSGAIVHYGTPNPDVLLEPGGMLLVDSGIQVEGATTDDTRTIAIGEPDPRQRLHFTDVLRAHIRLAMQAFPEGTTGVALDAIARAPLWNAGTDYGHGTGHGVGAYLNVHEGPQSISPRGKVPLEVGMVVSNEPGYYHAGWGGIRLENLYVVEEALGLPPHPSGKRWLRFSPLTLIPFDRRLIDPARLGAEETQWLAEYHARVEQTIGPLLDEPHRQWLTRACNGLTASG